MAFQLLMISLMALSGYFLIGFIGQGEEAFFKYFLISAYLTMHFFGLGLPVSLCALATVAIVLILLRSEDEIELIKLQKNVF